MSRHRLRGTKHHNGPTPTPLEMRIALAHYVERSIENGSLDSYSNAATTLGVTRARMTHICDLLLLTSQSVDRLMELEDPG